MVQSQPTTFVLEIPNDHHSAPVVHPNIRCIPLSVLFRNDWPRKGERKNESLVQIIDIMSLEFSFYDLAKLWHEATLLVIWCEEEETDVVCFAFVTYTATGARIDVDSLTGGDALNKSKAIAFVRSIIGYTVSTNSSIHRITIAIPDEEDILKSCGFTPEKKS